MGHAPVVAVCGLSFEARIAAGADTIVVCAGMPRRLAALLEDAITPATRGIVSFGLAGGLTPELRPGACIVARAVGGGGDRYETDESWSHRLLAALPGATHGEVAGVDSPVQSADDKHALHARTGAVAVDMESQVAARIAKERALPFAVLRVIADPVGHDVPQAALAGHRVDGSTDVLAILAALIGRPGEVAAVMRLAFDARTARGALLRCRRQLGEGFALTDAGEQRLDVA